MSSKPPPAFPFAHHYGGLSPKTEIYNPFDISNQFNNLNISQQPGQFGPQRQNSDTNKPLPPPPPPGYYARPPIPNALTPGNRQGLAQGEYQTSAIDYLPLRNPLPRPPQLFPLPDRDYPYPSPSHSAPPQESLQNQWSSSPPGGAYTSSSNPPNQGRPSLSAPPSHKQSPHRQRSSSVPSGTAGSSVAIPEGLSQCAGVTKSNNRCTRLVKTPPALGFINPDDEVSRYCFQHSKEILNVGGFYARNSENRTFVDFEAWIPKYLQEETKVLLRSHMEKAVSPKDEDGYIYCYELRDPKNKGVVHLKVGRAVNLVKRIDQWTKSCESKEPILRGWYPGPDESDPAQSSVMKGVVRAGSKGRNCHRLERLIHLELADLVIFKPYLQPGFEEGQAPKAPKSEETKANPKASTAKAKSTPKKAAAKAKSPAKKSKRKVVYSDTEDEDQEEEDYREDEDEDNEDVEEETDDAPSPSPSKPRSKRAKLQVRTPCKDCGQVHQEIFTFQRPTSGSLVDHEWDRIVLPVIQKWGGFVDAYT